MKILWKNMYRSIFKNRVEIISLCIITILSSAIIIGLTGLIAFLSYQHRTINNQGNNADFEIVYDTQGPNVPTGYRGTVLGQFLFNPDEILPSPPTSFDTSRRSPAAIYQILSSIEFSAEGYGQANNYYHGDVELNVTNDRVFQNTNSSKNNNDIFKVIPIQGFAQNTGKSSDITLSENAFNNYPGLKPFAKEYLSDYWDNMTKTIDSESTWNSQAWNPITQEFNGVVNKPFGNVYQKINKTILLKGRYPTTPNEIDISYPYAYYKHINFGDILEINNVSYKVVGYATNPAYLYPQFSPNNLIPNNKTQCLVFTLYSFYDQLFNNVFSVQSLNDMELGVQIKIPGGNKTAGLRNQIKNDIIDNILPKTGTNSYLSLVDFSDSGYLYYNRMGFITQLTNLVEILTIVFTIIVLLTAAFSLTVIIKKQVEQDAKKLGILKALGYKSINLSTMYFVIPTIISLLSVIIGFVCGIIFWGVAVLILLAYFNFDVTGVFQNTLFETIFKNDYGYVILGIILPFIFVFLASWITAYVMVKQRVIDLIYRIR